MAITDRALQAFENELVKCLSFTFTTIRRVDKQGNARTILRVWMRNDSNLVLTGIRGSIAPGDAARFQYTTFHITRMVPQAEVEVAEITATIIEPTTNRFAYDRMARVNVSGGVDLASYRFKDTDRGLTYVAQDGRTRREPQPIRHGSGHGVERGSLSLPETGLPFESSEQESDTLEVDWSRVRGGSRRRPA